MIISSAKHVERLMHSRADEYPTGESGVFDNQRHSTKAVVIRDASTISMASQEMPRSPMSLEGLDSQPVVASSPVPNDGDTSAMQAIVQDVASISQGAYVDFAALGSILGEWQPSDPAMARVNVISELVSMLRARGLQALTGRGPDILVYDRYPLDLERGNKPSDVDRLLEKMIWDSHIYGCVIGVAYGVQDQSISEQLECVLEEFFEKEDMATIVLC